MKWQGQYQRKKDGRWEARITIERNENGGQKMKYFYGKTRGECSDKLNDYLPDKRKGIYIELSIY
jgi:AP2 domain.